MDNKDTRDTMEEIASGSITSPRGFSAGSTAAGIKKSGLDLCIVASDRPALGAGVFTTNKVKAAPVYLSQRHLQNGPVRAFVVNSGNANACTHERGMSDALEMARLTGEKLGVDAAEVLVASTGVIGVHLPMEEVRSGIAAIQLSPDGGPEAARAIMTTDTRPKAVAFRLRVGGHTVTIGGMAKGAGMIHPNMATMLGFLATDAALADPEFVRLSLREAVDNSFNMISIDGDTSTNDTLVLIANGAAENPPIHPGTPEAALFQRALNAAAAELAKAVARDGEGATKLIEVQVRGARDRADARTAARAVAASNLVKAAVYGADPNWGRILCAVGYSGAEVDQERADIRIGDAQLMKDGDILPFDKKAASSQLAGPDVFVYVDLHLGEGEATAWGCDLTEGYVDINAKYTT
jgi:glutamate N-acetyltransferase/amino-acid N-acetyltransferase